MPFIGSANVHMPDALQRISVLCMLVIGLSGCKPEPPKVQMDAPFITCAAFDFRVPDAEGLKDARRLMFEAAMNLNLRFVADAPFSGFRDVVGGLGQPMSFVLSSDRGPWTDELWLRVEFLAGGPPPRVPWLPDHKQPYIPPATCVAQAVDQFAKLRHLFNDKWQLTDLDATKPIPIRFKSAASQPLQK